MNIEQKENSANLSRRTVGLILLCFTILSIASNCIFPAFEGPDEHSHYHYARLLAQGKGLPIQTDPERSADAEGFNPPLYYLVPALILKACDPDVGAKVAHIGIVNEKELLQLAAEGVTLPTLNPDLGKPGDPRIFLHPRAGPFSSRMLNTIHWMRLFSTVCGIATLIGVWGIAREMFEGKPSLQLLTLCLVAFQPQFVYLTSLLNSDNLVTAFATIVIWRLAKLLKSDAVSFRDCAILGSLMGFGVLSKPNMLFLFAPVAVVLWIRKESMADFVRKFGFTLFWMLALAGWFFVRNALLYGNLDFFGWNKRAEIHPIFVLAPEHRWEFFAHRFLGNLFTSFWGRFSWLTISLPTWMYIFYAAISCLAIFALSALIKGSRDSSVSNRLLRLCLGVVSLNILSLIAFNFRFGAFQGRLLFPSLAAIMVILARGWESLSSDWPAETLRKRTRHFCLLLLGMDIIIQWFYIYPIYFS